VSIREVVAKVSELQIGFKSLEAQLADANVDSKFKDIMGPFAAKSKETIAAIESRGSKLDPSFKEVLGIYGEPPATECEDFFGTWSAFVTAMDVRPYRPHFVIL